MLKSTLFSWSLRAVNLSNCFTNSLLVLRSYIFTMSSDNPKVVKFITGNANKLREVEQVMEGCSFLKLVCHDLDLDEYQGEVNEVAIKKCKEGASRCNGPVLIEDTSLCFNALNGMPGPYIKWFLQAVGPAGLHKMLEGFEDKTAYALCTFAFTSGPGADVILFQGRCNGQIVAPRGETRFGWDPIFQPDGQTNTFAEMDTAAKSKISHRGLALKKLKSSLPTIL